MSAPPPPPPPHGEAPRSSGLPPGKYDIFVIPEHSAGSGFLYLPSLQPNVNSFAAGFASALILVAVFQSMAPAFRVWWEGFQGLGNMGITLLILGVGFGAWSLGRTQNDAPSGAKPSPSSGGGGSAGFGTSASGSHAGPPPPPPHGESSPPPPPRGGGAAPPPPQQDKPKPSWQQQRSTPQPGATKPETPKGSWEKAREETRKKEEERKAKEAEQKRREEAAKRLAELRAKEARERQEREKDRERREKEAQDKKDKDLAEKRKKDLEEKLANERKEREAKEQKAREDQQKAAAAGASRGGSSYAYSGVGEKTSMWPNGRPNVAPSQAGGGSPSKNPPSPGKKPPAPTAKTYVSADEDAHSFRPYDQPKPSRRRPSVSSVGGSESSWAPSHTTARTSPPPSFRGPYTTKDPDKIVINAVYLFMNQFAKTPASQLVSGVGSVTDGLILRVTTEGLFIDDDVRGVPQREWDVKAWTLKHVEVWCPPHCLNSAAAAAASASASNPAAGAKSPPHVLFKLATARRNADRDAKVLTGDEADAYLTEMLRACKDCCRLGLCERTFKNTNIQSPSGQTGGWKAKGLHILRATVRDQEGKRYMFVLDETESWKVAVGLQRLRRGTQVRQLGVSSMSPSEARGTLETLGWAE
ncbi:hypothetical protein Purlil1_10038 [Purpureocillium lilacinum]|uniref:Trans-sialidase-like protein n=1 Tax=Purpureocillium lilacinum TaxID=33203 RepID=A0ABR0BP35_PURLI|nr:hypothetical protein Purlil1_10038 [Purpureocillium lilacinum]